MKAPVPFLSLSQPEQLRLLAIWRPYWIKAERAYFRACRLDFKVKRPRKGWLMLHHHHRRWMTHVKEMTRREDRMRRAFPGLGSFQVHDLMEGRPLHPNYGCPLFQPPAVSP